MEKNRNENITRLKASNSRMPIILLSAGFVLILIFAFMLLIDNNRKIIDQDQITRISAEEALKAYKNGNALFLDVRVPEAYAESHIPGAISIPVAELEQQLRSLDPQQWIITYCT